MKTRAKPCQRPSAGYALLMVLTITAVSIMVLTATLSRTDTIANLNDRNNQYVINLNAAEAATEKVYAKMAYDFQSAGLGNVVANLDQYRKSVPTNSENSYWGNFQFSDAQGHAGKTYVNALSNYTGNLPSQYPGLFTFNSPVYRIVSNVKATNSRYKTTNAVQLDVMLALVPITTYAIFYNGLLEFTTCATMSVNGRVHANNKIYVGSSASLSFSSAVTAADTITAVKDNGYTPSGFPGNVSFNGTPYGYKTGVTSVALSMTMTNTHSLIDMPTTNDAATALGQTRLYNQAEIVLLVSNTTVYARIQASPSLGQVPGQDTDSRTIISSVSPTALSTNFPFLKLLWGTNGFYDQRESKSNLTTQIDIGKYSQWLTNSFITGSTGRFPAGSGTYPLILYVADNRTNTSSQMTVVRLTNGIAPPKNGGLGFSIATPNPLYVWGNYNQTNSANLNTTNTATGTVPCAFMCDALTILSSNWSDSLSASAYTSRTAVNTTVNAAILTGIVPSTGTTTTTFSGGVHNLPRLLEDWNSPSVKTLTLNTSIVNLYNSNRATHMFVNPGTYYDPPTRMFSFDLNFMDPSKQPPGVPCALVPIRFNWFIPPANTVTYNVTP